MIAAALLGLIAALAVYCVVLLASVPKPATRFGETIHCATVSLLAEGCAIALVFAAVFVWLVIFKTGGV